MVAAADGPQAEQLDSYVVVQKADVLDAIGTFVAAYLAELPEAQHLQPAQLQAALKTAFKVPFLLVLSPLAHCANGAVAVRRTSLRSLQHLAT